MEKPRSKLEIKDIATIEIINETEPRLNDDFNQTKEKLSNLKNDAAETAACLASINTRIKDHLEKMERIKKLNFETI